MHQNKSSMNLVPDPSSVPKPPIPDKSTARASSKSRKPLAPSHVRNMIVKYNAASATAAASNSKDLASATAAATATTKKADNGPSEHVDTQQQHDNIVDEQVDSSLATTASMTAAFVAKSPPETSTDDDAEWVLIDMDAELKAMERNWENVDSCQVHKEFIRFCSVRVSQLVR